MNTVLARRGFLTGLISLVAAPAIVKADSLMAIRGVSLYPKLFMTVTLDGFDNGTIPVAPRKLPGYMIPDLLTETLDVPWLGSVKDSMAWYNNKLTELQPKFSRVNSIQWKEHMNQSLFGQTVAEVNPWAECHKPIPEQLLDGKPFASSPVIKGIEPKFSSTMVIGAGEIDPGYTPWNGLCYWHEDF